jgi:hypothetical protein
LFNQTLYLPTESAVLPELSPNLNSTLSSIIVTEVEVANLISQLDTAKACGAGWMELVIKLLSFVIMAFTQAFHEFYKYITFSWSVSTILEISKRFTTL